MAERAGIPSPSMLSQEKPLVKIGHYVLGETLGVGTFGKVKSKCTLLFDINFVILSGYLIYSW